MAESFIERTRAKRSFIVQRLEKLSPLIVVVTDDGVLFGATRPAPYLRKIFLLHRSGLYLAGIGELDVLESVADEFNFRAHKIELERGPTAVSATEILARSRRDGMLLEMRRAFDSNRFAPYVVDMLLVEIQKEFRSVALHYISADAGRDSSDSYWVLASPKKADKIKAALVPWQDETPTRAAAQEKLREIWEAYADSDKPIVFSAVTYDAPDTLVELSEKGGM